MLSREDFYMIKQMRQQGAYIVDIATHHGAPQNNYAQAQRIDTDYQRLKKLIWPEGDS